MLRDKTLPAMLIRYPRSKLSSWLKGMFLPVDLRQDGYSPRRTKVSGINRHYSKYWPADRSEAQALPCVNEMVDRLSVNNGARENLRWIIDKASSETMYSHKTLHGLPEMSLRVSAATSEPEQKVESQHTISVNLDLDLDLQHTLINLQPPEMSQPIISKTNANEDDSSNVISQPNSHTKFQCGCTQPPICACPCLTCRNNGNGKRDLRHFNHIH